MRVFKPGWVPTLIVLPIFVFTVFLGFWQLSRAQEKQALLDTWADVMNGEALSMPAAKGHLASALPAKVMLQGAWVTKPLMVWENRRYQEKQGIHQLQWFQTSEDLVLVDRGWTALKSDEMSGEATIVGQLLIPEEAWRKPVLPSGDNAELSFPVLDLASVAQHLPKGRHASPYLVRLTTESAGVLTPVGQQHAVMPVRHRGYAFTWFSLSAAIVLLFLQWSFRKAK